MNTQDLLIASCCLPFPGRAAPWIFPLCLPCPLINLTHFRILLAALLPPSLDSIQGILNLQEPLCYKVHLRSNVSLSNHILARRTKLELQMLHKHGYELWMLSSKKWHFLQSSSVEKQEHLRALAEKLRTELLQTDYLRIIPNKGSFP